MVTIKSQKVKWGLTYLDAILHSASGSSIEREWLYGNLINLAGLFGRRRKLGF